MSTWYDALENIIIATNSTMADLAAAHREDAIELITETWSRAANALVDSIPEDFERDWPELYYLARQLGPDFCGVTSDTRKVVSFGADHIHYREFIIHEVECDGVLRVESDTRVMRHDDAGNGEDIGTAAEVFGADRTSIRVGLPQGEDDQRGAYEWWPLTLRGKRIGELRDDATGLTIHIRKGDIVDGTA